MLYLDASAFVKRYIEEEGSDLLVKTMEASRVFSTCRICFVEAVRAIATGGDSGDVKKMESEWDLLNVVEVDRSLTELAAGLAVSRGLRSLDALHLASALSVPADDLVFATWDARLHRAARAEGLETLPAELV